MSRHTFSLLISALFWSACSSTPEKSADETTEAVTETTVEANEEATSSGDMVLFTAMTNHMQMQLSEMAVEKATTLVVKEVGGEIALQSSEVLTKIQELAKTVEMDMPSTLTTDQQAVYDSLQELPSEAFEQAYVEVVHQDLKRNLKNLEGLAAQADNAVIRGLAADIADMQQPQLEKIEMLQQEIM